MPGLDFLDGDSPADSAAAPQADIVSAPIEVLAPVVEQALEPVAEVVAAAPVEAPHAPLAALLDERDKRKAADDRANAAEERLRAIEQQEREPVYIDPDTENLVLQTRLNLSEDLARDKFGDDVVEAAKQAAIAKFATSPAFQQEVLSQRNPYRFVVEWHQRESALGKIGDPKEIDAFLAWRASQAAGAPAPVAAPAAFTPPLAAAPPPVSLASASSAGGGQMAVPSGPGRAFDGVFQ